MALKDIASILREVTDRRPSWRNKMAWSVVWDAWDSIVGPKVSQHAYPEKIVDQGILVCCVTDSIWMQQLFLERFNIIQAINKRLPKGYALKDMRFKYGDPPGLRNRGPLGHRHRDANSMRSVMVPQEVLDQANALTSSIKDEPLRTRLTRAYIAYKLRLKELKNKI